ncbi:MAG TPA: helix-turn-helix domain-containing protein [Pyrinomonadaceae bacterium]|nr:helix-turn-helix domain-containing protein [Pyrinomonadaceae bacterium]
MGHKRPTPQRLPAKLQAIRDSFGVSQYRLSKSLQVGRTRLSEWEWGRRMPSWFVLIRYAKLAGVPLEFIVDDEIDLDYFKHHLSGVDRKRGELNQPEAPEEHRMVIYWRTSSVSDPKHDDKLPCPGCGSPLEKDTVSGRYVCDDCNHEWEGWEVLESLI